MVTREDIIAEIQRVPDEHLEEVYTIRVALAILFHALSVMKSDLR